MPNIQSNASIVIAPTPELRGVVTVPGDKVAAVHVTLASILSQAPITILNTHNCNDVLRIQTWVEEQGIATIYNDGTITTITPIAQGKREAFDLSDLSDTRGNICLIAPLALRGIPVTFAGTAGCGFTKRGVDRHFDLMKAFNLNVTERNGLFEINSENEPTDVEFSCATKSGTPSVGVTCHGILAGLSFKGKITLKDCAMEAAPSTIIELVKQATGRDISMSGTTIEIAPIATITHTPATITLTPDVTVAATYIAAVTATGGEITLTGIEQQTLPKSLRDIYHNVGVSLETKPGGITVSVDRSSLRQARPLTCSVWPALPSDVAPILAASLAGIPGDTSITDTVYDTRASHVAGLNQLGYNLTPIGQMIRIGGVVPRQQPEATVEALDIRAGAALIIGALGGNTKKVTITNIRQVRRGYMGLIEQLQQIGATITLQGVSHYERATTGNL